MARFLLILESAVDRGFKETRGVYSYFLVVVINSMTKGLLVRKVLLHPTSHHPGKPREELKAGAWRGNKQRPQRTVSNWFLFP